MRKTRIMNRSLFAGVVATAALLAAGATAVAVTDATPPVASNIQPSGTIYSSSATLSANYSDPAPSSGIDSGSAMIHLDNRHVNGCTVSATRISCPVSGLSRGAHKLEVFICDMAGNCAHEQRSFSVGDKTPPVVDGITVKKTSIQATYHDPAPASGINSTTARVKVDGAIVSGCAATASGVNCPFPQGLGDGQHKVDVSIADSAGNTGSGSGTFVYISAGQVVVQVPAAVDGRI